MAASGAPAPAKAGAMAEFWRGRRVLLTGHTGFKGAWMNLWLSQMGAEVTGYALAPAAEPNLWDIVAGAGKQVSGVQRSIISDIRDARRVDEAVAQCAPQSGINVPRRALAEGP